MGFAPATPGNERSHTHALNRVATGIASQHTFYIQGDQNVSVHLMISLGCDEKLCVFEQTPHNWWFEDGHHRIHSQCGPCYTEHGLREQFGVSINVWRLLGDSLNITCNFLYFNLQVHVDIFSTLYVYIYFFSPIPPHVPYGLRGLPSRLWPKCNRLLRLSRRGGWLYMDMKWMVIYGYEVDGDIWIWSTRRGLKHKLYWTTQTMVTMGIFSFKEKSPW
jgi:hypothetical protein